MGNKIATSSISLEWEIKTIKKSLDMMDDTSRHFSQGTLHRQMFCEREKIKDKELSRRVEKMRKDYELLRLRHSEDEIEREAYKTVQGDQSFEWLLRAKYKSKSPLGHIDSEIGKYYGVPCHAMWPGIVFG